MKITLACGGQTVSLHRTTDTPATVEGILYSVQGRLPQLFSTWCDESGRLRESLTVFVNQEHIRYRRGFQTELMDGDEVYVVPLIAGG
jgi:molybdopterin synthase sulfur carrier subunit